MSTMSGRIVGENEVAACGVGFEVVRVGAGSSLT